ncbi:MAG: glycosyltransferase family 4 protein [Rhodoferax sp.]
MNEKPHRPLAHGDVSDLPPVSPTGPRLRIAVLCRQASVRGGGAERYALALVEQLAPNHDIHVFAQHIEHDAPGVQYHRIAQPLHRPRWINQLWFALATAWATRRGFDVVHSHEMSWHGQVQTVHVLPVRYTLFQGLQGTARVLRWIKVLTSPRLLTYLALERARFGGTGPRCVVLTSDTLLAQTRAAYPHCRWPMPVITPGVDRVCGPASPALRAQARTLLGLPEAGSCVLMVANDARRKGLGTLIEALAQLPAPAYVALVGNPAQRAQWLPTLQSSGLQDRVFFLGSAVDVSVAYTAADVLAHPTREDTFGMVVLEAMAHGVPVVVSAAPWCGMATLLTHGVHALVLPDPHDAAALADALRRLLRDAPLRHQLQRAGHSLAQQHLWQQQARAQEALYRELSAG